MTWYTMLFCTTWYQHEITWYKIMIHRQQISCPVSCRVGIMSLYQWYRDMIPEWHDLGYEMTNKLYLYFYIMISLHIITYHYTCNGIIWYRVISYHVISSVWWGSLTSVWEVLVGSFLTSWGEGWSWDLPHRPSCQPPCTGSGVLLTPFRLSSTSHPSSTSGLGSWAVNCKRKAASARPVSLPWPSSAWLQGCERKCQSCGCPCTHIRGRMDSPCSGSRRIPPQAGSSWRRQQLRRCQPASQSPCQRPWALSRRCTTCICDITWYKYDIVNKLMISNDISWYHMILTSWRALV